MLNSLFLILTAIQWIPTLQFILLSARDTDQSLWQKEGWFLPWQHLVQFISPDFFGNPATLNYWGVWNYGELVGYVGIIPLVFALFALLSRLGKRTILFGIALVVSLLFALQGEPNIREVIAFPKTGEAKDLMMNSPSDASNDQLRELGLLITKK
jgi:hypothetical protein